MANGTVTLENGQAFTLTNRDVPGDDHEVGLTYPDLPVNVRAGDALLLADGLLELEVVSTSEHDIRCKVIAGGPLGSGWVLALLQPGAAALEDLSPGGRLLVRQPWHVLQVPGYPCPVVLCLCAQRAP